MKNKRGQFYLIIAVVIVGLLVTFITVANSAKKQSSTSIYDLSEELKIEAEQVFDCSLYSQNTATIDDFTKKFSEYAGKDILIIFITGNNPSIEAYSYKEGDKIPYADELTIKSEEKKISFRFEEVDYSFDLNPAQNFHFIIIHETTKEKYLVLSNERY